MSSHSSKRMLRAGLRETIGARLRAERKRRGLTAKALADAIGIRPDALSLMERGQQAIPAELLADWCHHLDTRLTFSSAGIEQEPQSLPPEYARLFNTLKPQYRKLVLDHLELVVRLSEERNISSAEE
ncbi:helix-turn-helix domain-containing protein [Microbulbifer thermotolerans]|uniref:helix-turn-helix domain-containing protein n=1 Tax=Microbulbifer thermotolerans TaxID=252514 RepID=UPI00224ACC5E|nr:helix-turn-helix transcriptional regulator [Microbulbifer thermotolerans]MCX2834473.1 helix-turn-helix domain-containing protein [Microbulbifer thermotolerans]